MVPDPASETNLNGTTSPDEANLQTNDDVSPSTGQVTVVESEPDLFDPPAGISICDFDGGGTAEPDPPDDFADDPDYREHRALHGPIPELDALRVRARRTGFRPLCLAQFRALARLNRADWLRCDPALTVRALRQALDRLEVGVASGRRFDESVTPAEDFLARDHSAPYLVEGVLPAGQLCVAGGPEKGQKSNLLIDMAVSLATGKPWLGRFAVPKPVKVLLLTGETQGANLQNIMGRVLESKELSGDALGGRLVIKEALPSLSEEADLATLRRVLDRERAEVVILDPIYLAMGKIDTHRLTEVGEAVARAGRVCAQAGATPVFAHHMSKSAQLRRGEEREPMQLADLNGAGFGPVAGSWLLVNYLVPYDPDTGRCTLWLNLGGRAGHGGLYSASIDENTFQRGLPFNGRRWRVQVQGGQQAVQAAEQVRAREQQEREAAREEAKQQAQAATDEKVMEQIRTWLVSREPYGANQSEIGCQFGVGDHRVKRLLHVMAGRLWAVRAQRLKHDNPKVCRWRSTGSIPPGPLADLLRQGVPYEDAVKEAGGPGGQPA